MAPTSEQLAFLRASFDAVLGPMPDASWELGARLFSYRPMARDEYLLHAGDVSDWLYFALKGVLRQFYTTEDGKEFNKSFSVEGEPCGSFRSALAREPSRFGIQALESGELLRVRFAELMALFDRDVHWERVGRRGAEYQTLLNEEREAEFLLDTAAVRYRRFRERHPGLGSRIAQYHIASYLGITPVALSRIRGKLRDD